MYISPIHSVSLVTVTNTDAELIVGCHGEHENISSSACFKGGLFAPVAGSTVNRQFSDVSPFASAAEIPFIQGHALPGCSRQPVTEVGVKTQLLCLNSEPL